MTINEIIDYVVNSPENTNPNVLRSILGNQVSGGQELPEGALVCLPVEVDETTNTLNKTWNEINQGFYYMRDDDGYILILTAVENSQENNYYIIAQYAGNSIEFVTDTPDGYPTLYIMPINPNNPPIMN